MFFSLQETLPDYILSGYGGTNSATVPIWSILPSLTLYKGDLCVIGRDVTTVICHYSSSEAYSGGGRNLEVGLLTLEVFYSLFTL